MIDIVGHLCYRFGIGSVKWELEYLAFKKLNKEAYEDLVRKVKSKRKEREAYIKKFAGPITKKLDEFKIEYDLSGRAKHLYSIYRKMIKR